MTNDARRVGSQFETDVRDYLRNLGYSVERLAKAGKLDEGDLLWRTSSGAPVICELKARRDRNSALNLGGWLEEAHRESDNYRAARNLTTVRSPLLIVKNPRKPIGKSFVIQYLEDYTNGRDEDV